MNKVNYHNCSQVSVLCHRKLVGSIPGWVLNLFTTVLKTCRQVGSSRELRSWYPDLRFLC